MYCGVRIEEEATLVSLAEAALVDIEAVWLLDNMGFNGGSYVVSAHLSLAANFLQPFLIFYRIK